MTEIYEAKTEIYDPKTFDPKTGIGGLIARVRVKLFEALDEELAPFDITAAQYVILVNLANGVDSASGLCKGVSYDPGAMTRMIDRLERKGFVRRVRSPEDRRVVNLALTEEGKAVYPKLVARAAAATNRRLRGFTKAEAQQLESFLQRMLVND
ncbi:MAG TPA: MarR family transcriptional regulator [Casimicrobiaceae bacterium]|jgi:DNA-binding MarR family transcriptional regulator|nr:MarR family transcriptional regulator [Casimicrobiaceae bacterium]